jgi:hypothetical protein
MDIPDNWSQPKTPMGDLSDGLPCLKKSAGRLDEEVRFGKRAKDIHSEKEKMNMKNGTQLWIGIHNGKDGIQVRPYFQDGTPTDEQIVADFGRDGRIDIRGPFDVPCKAVLEMAYDDFSPDSQGTPSRIESVLCASDDEAEAVADKVQKYIDQRYPEQADLWFVYADTSHTTRNPATATKLVDEMMEHYLSDDDAER